MLQVPCLSPPIYGRSHYKKFWLRQTSEKDPSGIVSSSGDHMKGSTTTAGRASSPDGSSMGSKRICGKRRPQLRCSTTSSSSSSIKVAVAVDHDRGDSPTSSSGDLDTNGSWKRSSLSSSTVVDREDGEEATPKSHLFQEEAAAVEDGQKKFTLALPGVGATVSEDDPALAAAAGEDDMEEIAEEKSKVMVVRQNMVSFDDRSEQAAVDCLTSKCKQEDDDHGLRSRRNPAPDTISNSSATATESDSTTSSTSQASDDHDDARSLCEKSSSLRQYMKRHPKVVSSGEIDPLLLGSPRTRQAAAATSGGASVDNPVSPSGRSGSRGDGMPSVAAHGNNNVSTRTCKHCGTMKTPLWRNGPLGPKSLCNACGIRLRKARRNNNNNNPESSPVATPTGKRKPDAAASSPKVAGHPCKKSRLAFAREKRQIGSMMRLLPLEQQQQLLHSSSNRSVSKDEEEGAVLLMALSCGLVLA